MVRVIVGGGTGVNLASVEEKQQANRSNTYLYD
jgi:hypothetical protein